MNSKKKTIIKIIVVIMISIVISIFAISLIKDPQTFIDTIEKEHHSIFISFILLSITQTIIPIIPGEPVELIGGYIFGKIYGTIICLITESIASIIIILLTRKYGNKIIEFIFNNKKIKSIEILKSKKSFKLFAILFIIPGTPKDLLCYFSGLAEYDLIPLIIITTIGRIPAIATSTISAGFFQEKKYLISILIYLVTVLICFIDILIYENITKNKTN